MVAVEVDAVVRLVDTHKDRHTAAFTDPVGVLKQQIEIGTDPAGYARLLKGVDDHAPGRRVGRSREFAATVPGRPTFRLAMVRG